MNLWKLFVFLALAFVGNLRLAHFAGFKGRKGLGASLAQAADTVAVGSVASVIALLVFNRISPDDPLDATLGKVVLQALPLASSPPSPAPSSAPGRKGRVRITPAGPPSWSWGPR